MSREDPRQTCGPVYRPYHGFPPPPGRQLESVKAEAAEKGDVGLVAESSRSTQRLVLPPPALTAAGVFAKFRDIARLAGSAVSGAGWASTPRPSALPLGDPEAHMWPGGLQSCSLGLGCFGPACGAGGLLPQS